MIELFFTLLGFSLLVIFLLHVAEQALAVHVALESKRIDEMVAKND